jgi:hypothetical protein
LFVAKRICNPSTVLRWVARKPVLFVVIRSPGVSFRLFSEIRKAVQVLSNDLDDSPNWVNRRESLLTRR